MFLVCFVLQTVASPNQLHQRNSKSALSEPWAVTDLMSIDQDEQLKIGLRTICRCDVCDYGQDDGRKTVSKQRVQRFTSKSEEETAQTQTQGPLRQTNTGAHEKPT